MRSTSFGLLLLLALALEDTPTERDLAERIKDGDRTAFRRFFERHHGRLLGYLRSRGIPSDVAEDLVQNAFLYVWEHRDEIDPNQSLRAYLFRIGYTRALNHHRDTSKFDADADLERAPSSEQGTPEANAMNAELRAQIDDAIGALPERRRAVFELCFLQDCAYQEAADALDITQKTVEAHMRLALRDLREALADVQ
jgi:RNA polymerase sigma-70 factor (ECF subfamily)